jgi:hypothetical protein
VKAALKLGLVIALSTGCAVASKDFDDNDSGTLGDSGKDAGATGDAQSHADGSVPLSTKIACGTGWCRADQKCNTDVCTMPCVGTNVPGDYATVAAALSALGNTDATICLQGQSYSESPSASGSGKTLTIIGPNNAHLNSLTVGGSYSKVYLKGFEVGTLSISSPAPVEATAMKMGQLYVQGSQGTSVMVDGCNIEATSSYAVQVYRSYATSPGTVTIQNSWIHGATSYGVYLSAYQSQTTTVSLLNDTIEHNGTGIYASNSAITLTYANDIIANNTQTGVSLSSVGTVTHSNNVLWGNQTNYAGTATDGPGYVKVDPMLDSDSPPAPMKGSPAHGAGDMSKMPTKDFWASSRIGADIGAVQGQ